MEKYIKEQIDDLLNSENIDDQKLGIILASKNNYPIYSFNVWFGNTSNDHLNDLLKEFSDSKWDTASCYHYGKYEKSCHYKFITEWKTV